MLDSLPIQSSVMINCSLKLSSCFVIVFLTYVERRRTFHSIILSIDNLLSENM